jgi:hypothetical protein
MEAILNTLEAMTYLYSVRMTREALVLFLSDLEHLAENDLLESLRRCRRELKRFPTVADIIERLPNSFPGAEEAWARCPKSDAESVAWTDQMREAYALVDDMIYTGQLVEARMAFKEKYKQLVCQAIAHNQKPNWSISLGEAKPGREIAMKQLKELAASHNKKRLELVKNPCS